VRLDRWQVLSEAEKEDFPPLCPDLTVELASRSDDPEALRRRMVTYFANGARLGCSVMSNGWKRARSFRA